MLVPATFLEENAVVLLGDLPTLQRIALQKLSVDLEKAPGYIDYSIYRDWYLDDFYPNKARAVTHLTQWLAELVQHQPIQHPKDLKCSNHQKTLITYVQQTDNDCYSLRAKVYDVPSSIGYNVEMKVKMGKVIHFEVLSYFSFERHQQKEGPSPWKSFLVLGKKDGLFTMYHPDGSILQTGAFNAGKRVGLWTRYDQDAQVVEEQIYECFGI